ncbi:MAG: oligosaccharide flippase family protein [Thermosynechococcaceae cyanobacterium MS004]|nr:oligosaccharide flippase family protein [Thermosynechococcaceae cyanobacterium MS004]
MLSNTISILFVKGFSIFARIISLLILAKFSSPDEFGIISLMVAVAEILKFIADFGIDTLSVRDFAISPNKKTKRIIASNVAVIKLILGLAVYCLMLLGISLSKYYSYILIGSLSGILLLTPLWSNLTINYFQSQLMMNQLVVPTLATSALSILLMLAAISMKANAVTIFSAIPFSEILTTVILYFYLAKEVKISKSYVSVSKIKDLLKKSFPIALTSISVMIYTRLDIFFLGYFSSKSEIGYYAIAYRITEPFLFVAVAFSISIYSNISSRLLDPKNDALPSIKRYIILAFSCSSLICVFLIILSPIFIKNLLPDYLPALPILYALSVALVFRILNSCLTSIINAYGKYTKITMISLLNLIVVSLLILVSRNNINGFKIGSILTVAEFLNTILQLYVLSKLIFKRFV